jgi:transcription initiation factor TFIIIB Brf1 subunit/transcription initiation factor TFIIB
VKNEKSKKNVALRKLNLTMSEFQLFNQALDRYEKNRSSGDDQTSDEDNQTTSCEHTNVFTDKGVTVCTDCGEEISRKLSHDKEWRYYGPSDTKRVSDPNRVQLRKTEERSIYKDVENLGFSESIVKTANIIYSKVTKGKIFRGNSRKAIVFACIFHAFKMSGNPLSHERLISIFKLNRKTGLKGLKYVNLYAPKDSAIRTTYITPINLVEEIMDQFDASDAQKDEVKKLYGRIHNKSSRLNRSRPQSVAAGLTFYWICIKQKDISLKDFTEKVTLSELTINKIAKEIALVLGTPNVIGAS